MVSSVFPEQVQQVFTAFPANITIQLHFHPQIYCTLIQCKPLVIQRGQGFIINCYPSRPIMLYFIQTIIFRFITVENPVVRHINQITSVAAKHLFIGSVCFNAVKLFSIKYYLQCLYIVSFCVYK